MSSESLPTGQALRDLANEVAALASAAGVKMPEEEAEARKAAGRALMTIANDGEEGTLKDKATAELEKTFGLNKAARKVKREREAAEAKAAEGADTPSKKKKAKKAPQCACEENQGLYDAFKEFQKFMFETAKEPGRESAAFGARALSKTLKYMKEIETKIESGQQLRDYIMNGPEPKDKRCCGPKNIKRIDEFVADGTFEDLEAYRDPDD